MAVSCPEKRVIEKKTVEDIISDIGFGRYQLRSILLGGTVQCCMGVHVALVAVVTVPLAADLHLNHNQKALLSTLFFMGMTIGTILSGQFGDQLGRRQPIVLSNLMVTVFGVGQAFLTNYGPIAAFRLLIGLGVGVGFPPTVTCLSEVTPRQTRIAVRALTDFLFDIGYGYVAIVALFLDPNLREMSWQRVVLFSAGPPALMALGSMLFLPESPMYLAAKGRHEETKAMLESMRSMNRNPTVDIDYDPKSATQDGDQAKVTFMERFNIIFSKRFIAITFTLAYTGFMVNGYNYGGFFAQPQVMEGGQAVAPAVELILGAFVFDVFGLALVSYLVTKFPKHILLRVGMAVCATVSFAFGRMGILKNRAPLAEIIFQYGVFGNYWLPAALFVILWQKCAETFPTSASATGCSIIMAIGRVGGLVSPLIFENCWAYFGTWFRFFDLCTVGCLVSAVLIWRYIGPEDRPEEEQPLVSVKGKEAKLTV